MNKRKYSIEQVRQALTEAGGFKIVAAKKLGCTRRTLDSYLVGHFHRRQMKTFKAIDGMVYWTAAVGYLAGPLDWAPLNRWDQGCAIIRYDQNGEFRAEVKTILNGQVY